MTAENNGTGATGDDDPFGYLYRQENGGTDAATRAAQQPGVPRRSYNQVRAVGERQYGARAGVPQQGAPHGAGPQGAQQGGGFPQQGMPGQAPGGPGGPAAHNPNAHYAAPETVPGGRAATRAQGAPGGGRGRGGGSHNGLLIGAVAVVAAVVIGIGAAMIFNGDGGDTAGGDPGATPTAGAGGDGGADGGQDSGQQAAGDKKDGKDGDAALPKEDAAALRLGGKAQLEKTIPGAKGKNGMYVAGMNTPGSSARWRTEVPKAGQYNLHVRYTVPGKDMHLSLAVNGKDHATGLNMENFAKAPEGDWSKGWTYTYATVNVHEGANVFDISCQAGDSCDVNLDQVWLEPAK
ncbi:hypothetical protein [Streptomyces sp. JJ36]|uniref:hypothetical protein n=1 Tax=Streptomyces sp. JJ36 TaxID=2736645 RepID=UPI001F235CCB|nr:hypothetical protein [Streptomyces sp. JJ36]MCF6523124.1 hypothetical protein [Streptomyces sp. JJ36]